MTTQATAPPLGSMVTTYRSRMDDDVRNQKEYLALLIKFIYI